jgi:hypothetical protein
MDNEDELIWDPSPSGIYSPKLGYLKYNSDLGLREPVWWWRNLWKVKSPAKTRLFMWNVLQNKVLTWDNLQKRNFVGPGWCSLCKSEGETILHLFLNCRFINKVWKETSRLLNLHCVWEGRDLDHSWFTWWKTRDYKLLRALPLLVIWAFGSLGIPLFSKEPLLPLSSQQLEVSHFFPPSSLRALDLPLGNLKRS